MNYNTLLSGKDNPLKNQRSSEGQLDYAKNSTGAISMPQESLQNPDTREVVQWGREDTTLGG